VLGPRHPDTLTSLNNLAFVYQAVGRYGEAEPLYREALLTRREVLGPRHPDTLISLNNLAALYRALGRYGEAEPVYWEALQASREVLGPRHPNTLGSLNNLAGLYQDQKSALQEPQFDNDRRSFLDRVIGDRYAAINRLLQDDFLDVVGAEATFDEGRAHMQPEFVPLTERNHGSNDQYSSRSLIEVRPSPDVAPRIARNQILEIGIERIEVGDRLVDPFISQNPAALIHAAFAAAVIVHGCPFGHCEKAKR
jgi:tetratricopeptide (TPR) repeat protein